MARAAQPMLPRRQLLLAGLALPALACLPARAASPDPLLRITDTAGKVTAFDEAQLLAMPQHTIDTHTFWTDGPQNFKGPKLSDVLELAAPRTEIAGRIMRMRALNDFSVDVPANDAWDYSPILAREKNGVAMAVRDKGPLWLIYPRDNTPVLQDPIFDDRWIWQLCDIQIL